MSFLRFEEPGAASPIRVGWNGDKVVRGDDDWH